MNHIPVTFQTPLLAPIIHIWDGDFGLFSQISRQLMIYSIIDYQEYGVWGKSCLCLKHYHQTYPRLVV